MQQMNVHRHWSRRVEGGVVVFGSIICSVASAHAVWWFFSGMNWVDNFQWLVTILLAIVFVSLGFVISRSVAHRIQHKQKLGMVLVIALLYEIIEIGCCFTLAAVAVQHVSWLPLLHGGLYSFVSFLCYILLPSTPAFTIGLGYLEVGLDREKHGQEAPSGPIRQQPAPVNFQTTMAGAARPATPVYTPPAAYNTGYQPQQTTTNFNSMGSNTVVPPQASYPPVSPYAPVGR